MERPMVLPLPGNSTREQNFYDQQSQPAQPGPEWPGSANLETGGQPVAPDPLPFTITEGGR